MITLNFNTGIPNTSLEVGDNVYFVDNPSTMFYSQGAIVAHTDSLDNSTNPSSDLILLGQVAAINILDQDNDGVNSGFNIFVDEEPGVTTGDGTGLVGAGDFIFFSKDRPTNTSSILGYYNSVTFINSSTKPAELFAASCDFVESSK